MPRLKSPIPQTLRKLGVEAQSIRRKLDPESPGLQGLAGPLMLLHVQSFCCCFTPPWALAASLPLLGLAQPHLNER